MKLCPECKLAIRAWLSAILIYYSIYLGVQIPVALSIAIIVLPLVISLGFSMSLAEILPLALPTLILSLFTNNLYAVYIPFAAGVFTTFAIRSGRKLIYFINIVLILVAAFIALKNYFNFLDVIFISVGLLTILVNIGALFYKISPLKDYRIITDGSEFSKNISEIVEKAAQKDGVGNYERSQNSVIIFKNNFFSPDNKLYEKIPKATGKNAKAIIIYNAFLYPDMPYLFLWIYLVVKGYSVMGRVYFSDFENNEYSNAFIHEAALDFFAGFRCGLAFVLLTFPISFFSTLLKKSGELFKK